MPTTKIADIYNPQNEACNAYKTKRAKTKTKRAKTKTKRAKNIKRNVPTEHFFSPNKNDLRTSFEGRSY